MPVELNNLTRRNCKSPSLIEYACTKSTITLEYFNNFDEINVIETAANPKFNERKFTVLLK